MAVALLGLFTLGTHAQQAELAADLLRGTPAQRAALQQLFRPENQEAEMGAALQAARAAGVSEQIMLEAQLLWGLKRQDTAFLQSIVPELEMQAKAYRPEDAVLLRTREEFEGWRQYVNALAALAQRDEEAFEAAIKEAFWNLPGSAPLFAQVIDALRREQRMANLKLNLNEVLTTSQGRATTLKDVLGSSKALLVDFWASWCGPCMALMPELRKKAEHLAPYGVVVAGMNTDAQNAETVAEKVRRERDFQIPWLVEPGNRPFSRMLGLTSIPAMALLDAEGQVLFFGHPEDPALWQALKKVDPSIEPPSS